MPVYNCKVPRCTSDSRKHGHYEKYPWMMGVTFHSFPSSKKEAMKRRTWIRMIRRSEGWEPTRHDRICSLHFVGGHGPTAEHQMPTLFPHNNWKKSNGRQSNAWQSRNHHGPGETTTTTSPAGPSAHKVTDTDHMGETAMAEIRVSDTETVDLGCETEHEVPVAEVPEVGMEQIVGDWPHISFAPRMTVQDYSCMATNPDHTYAVSENISSVDHDAMDKICQASPLTCSVETQTNITGAQLDDMLKHDVPKVQVSAAVARRKSLVEKVTESDKTVKLFTGLPSLAVFYGLFSLLVSIGDKLKYWRGQNSAETKAYAFRRAKPGPDRKLTQFEEYIVVLARFRLALSTSIMADLFGIAESRVSQIFVTWMNFMYQVLSPTLKWPTKDHITKYLPQAFSAFPRTRAIIDCTEIFIAKPRSPTAQAVTYSTYKSHNTYKILVAISPSGAFTFVSDPWGGNVSDRYITEHCGFLDLVEPGDDIIADRGFTISDLLLQKGATLNMPPFTRKCAYGNKKRLNLAEINKTRKIAKVRIHVERAIERLKNFKMLSDPMPISLSPVSGQMVAVGAALCNFQPPLVK